MNRKTIKLLVEADMHRRLKTVLYEFETLENESTGAFKLILNTDRMILFQAMGRVLNVSQCDVLHNRDELSFFESLIHLFRYYMYDDGELTIRWEKYNLDAGKFIPCNKKDKQARPYFDYAQDDNEFIARENEILWIIDWYEREKKKRIQGLIEDGIYDGSLDKSNFIDYFSENR